MTGFRNRSSFTPGLAIALPSHTRGGSRMRESRTYGSVRGACDETHVPTATRNLLRCICRFLAVRPEGADHQWRKIPPGELSIDPVADERLVRVTARDHRSSQPSAFQNRNSPFEPR